MTQSLGLFSATTLVVGSMIGSGIFIVDSDIARGTDSPALYLAAWVVTAVMTMICALSYGELAAMMPKAGGQYVYLRESLGPLWGFLYGWTLFLVIQTGTIAAVCVAFGKFLGVFFPSVSSTHWLWHIAHVPAIPGWAHGAGQHGDRGEHGEPGRHHRRGDSWPAVNISRREAGRADAECVHVAKALSLAGLVVLGFTVGRNSAAIAANFGRALEPILAECGLERAASRAGGRGRADRAGEPVGDSGGGAGGVAVFCRCVEQRDVYGGRNQESAAEYSAVAGAGHGVCADGRIFWRARLT